MLDQRRAARCESLVAVHKGVTVGAWRIDAAGWRSWEMPTVGLDAQQLVDDEYDVDGHHRLSWWAARCRPSRPDGRAVFGSGAAIAYLEG